MDKGERNFLIFLFILSAIIFGVILFFSSFKKPTVVAPKREETEIEKQLREIETLRGGAPTPESRTTKSIQEQLEEIEKLREQIK